MITDELREYVQDWRDTPCLMDDLDSGDVDGILEDFIRIADRIDEQHRKALEKVSAMVDEPDYFGTIIDANSTPRRIDALEQRVSAIERKLNHKG